MLNSKLYMNCSAALVVITIAIEYEQRFHFQ